MSGIWLKSLRPSLSGICRVDNNRSSDHMIRLLPNSSSVAAEGWKGCELNLVAGKRGNNGEISNVGLLPDVIYQCDQTPHRPIDSYTRYLFFVKSLRSLS